MIVLVILSSLVLFTQCETEIVPKVHIVPAVHFHKVDDVIIYEGSIPLAFTINFPDKAFETDNELYSNMIESVKSSHGHAWKYKNPRGKRQVFFAGAVAGFLLRPMINKFSHNFFGDEEDNQRIQEIQYHQREFQVEVVNYTHQLTDELNDQRNAIESINGQMYLIKEALTKLWKLTSAKFLVDDYKMALMDCKERRIPSTVLPMEKIQKPLTLLKSTIWSSNYTTAFDFFSPSILYKLPLADCIVGNNTITVIINVPFKRVGVSYDLFEIQHNKFAFEGNVCELYPSEATLLAKERRTDQHVLITKNLLKHCSPFHEKLCLIPPYTMDSTESLNCVAGMMKGVPILELRKYCGFRCARDNGLIIQQLTDTSLIVTNAKRVVYFCGGKNATVTVPQVGSLVLELVCKCTLHINGVEMPHRYPCQNINIEKQVHIRLPSLWTEMDILNGDQSLSVKNEKIVDKLWHKKMPVFNFTIPKEESDYHFYVHYAATSTTMLIVLIVSIYILCLKGKVSRVKSNMKTYFHNL